MTSPGTVLITFPGFDPSNPSHAAPLEAVGLRIRYAPKTGPRDPSEVAELVGDAVAAIVSTDPFDASVFAACPQLRVLARSGVGVDSIDLDSAAEAQVIVTTATGANNEAVADHTLALMLAANRRIVELDAAVRQGKWPRDAHWAGWDLHGATVGIIGLGSIGRAVARRLRGFDCVVLASDPIASALEDVESVSLGELLPRSDVVTLHAPLDPSRRPLLGRHELAQMKRGAVLVNTARGGLVDEDALASCLIEGHLRAAALDVFADEPPSSSPLIALPNVILTPHAAGLTEGANSEIMRLASESILEVLAGNAPGSVANEGQLISRWSALRDETSTAVQDAIRALVASSSADDATLSSAARSGSPTP